MLFFFFFQSIFVFGNERKKDSLLQLISVDAIDTVKVNVLLQLALEYKKENKSKSFIYAREAIKLAEMAEYSQGMAKSNQLIGDLYRSDDFYSKAKEHYFKAFDLFKELNDQKGMSSTSNYIGMMSASQGLYPEALKFYFVSLRLNEKMGDVPFIAISYNNIGNINDLLGNYEEALSFYFRSLKLKEKTGNKAGVANTNNNIGEIYKKLGKYNEAMEYYSRSLQQKRLLNNDPGIANTLNNIGEVFLLRNDFKQSLQHYKESLQLLEKVADKEGIVIVNNNIGILFLKMKEYTLAVDYLKTGLALATELGLTEEQHKAYLALAEAYEKQGNYKSANEYIRLNAIIKDSILSNKNTELISEMQAKYVYNENKKEIALLTKEKALQQYEIYTNRIIIVSFIIGCVLLLILIIVGVRGYRQKQKAIINITKQKEEKELLLKEVHHRVKNNLQIINSLLRLQSHQVDDEKVAALFEECQNRVLSMALIHEKLYKSKDLANINARNYIETLAESLIRSYRTDNDVALEVNCSVDTVGIDTLMPLGLVLNELISNSLKYAFAGRASGKIMINLDKKENDLFEMRVSDNGIGLSNEFSWGSSTTLGMELIKTLVDQIKGTIEIIRSPGTTFKIVFRDLEKE